MQRIFELNLPPGEPQTEFLTYFNSGLKEIQESGTATASFDPDGSFNTFSNSIIRIGQEKCSLLFSLHTQASGILTHLEVEQIEETNVDWERFVNSLVTTALSKALSKQRTQYFHRMQLSYFGANMDGEYWISNFRLAPAIPEDPFPHIINAERIIYLDFHSNAVDKNQAVNLAQEFSTLQSARLSLLLNISLLKPDLTMRWVTPTPSSEIPNPESVRWNTIFTPKNPLPQRMPNKEELCKLGKFNGSLADRFRLTAGDLVTLPEETRKIFRLIQDNIQFRYAFDACARLYQLSLAISRYSISASLAYRVASIDAICNSIGTMKGPSDFIRRYAPETVNDEILDFLYGKVRSAHFHAGETPLDNKDFIPFHPFFTSNYLLQEHLKDQGFWITRKAILAWVLEEVKKVLPIQNS